MYDTTKHMAVFGWKYGIGVTSIVTILLAMMAGYAGWWYTAPAIVSVVWAFVPHPLASPIRAGVVEYFVLIVNQYKKTNLANKVMMVATLPLAVAAGAAVTTQPNWVVWQIGLAAAYCAAVWLDYTRSK